MPEKQAGNQVEQGRCLEIAYLLLKLHACEMVGLNGNWRH